MSVGSIDPAALLSQVKTLEINQMPLGTAGATSSDLIGEAVSASVAKLRSQTAEMSRNMESVKAERLSMSNVDNSLRSVYAGTDSQSVALRTEMAPGRVQSDMPHRSEISESTARNIAILQKLSEISHGTIAFTIGTSLATKSDGAIKMFVQAQ